MGSPYYIKRSKVLTFFFLSFNLSFDWGKRKLNWWWASIINDFTTFIFSSEFNITTFSFGIVTSASCSPSTASRWPSKALLWSYMLSPASWTPASAILASSKSQLLQTDVSSDVQLYSSYIHVMMLWWSLITIDNYWCFVIHINTSKLLPDS